MFFYIGFSFFDYRLGVLVVSLLCLLFFNVALDVIILVGYYVSFDKLFECCDFAVFLFVKW